MKIAEHTLIDCAIGLSFGPFELLDRACHRAEVGNIAKWEIINRDGKLVAWGKCIRSRSSRETAPGGFSDVA